MRAMTVVVLALAGFTARRARADEQAAGSAVDVPVPAPDPSAAPPAPAAPGVTPSIPAPDEVARIDELEDRIHVLERELRRAASARDQVKSLLPLTRFITVFVDVGAFVVGGDGSGIRSDLDHIYF